MRRVNCGLLGKITPNLGAHLYVLKRYLVAEGPRILLFSMVYHLFFECAKWHVDSCLPLARSVTASS